MPRTIIDERRKTMENGWLISAGLCLLSSALLILAFPKTDYWPLAWFSLIPFFCALDQQDLRRSFLFSYVTGIVFFTGTLYWFIYVTYLGAALLILYCAFYFGIFGLAYHHARTLPLGRKIILVCCCWTGLELIRANFLSGFGWASLGYSQYRNPVFIQFADITGVAGVSFFIVLINISLKEIVGRVKLKQNCFALALFNVAVVSCVWFYGQYRLGQDSGKKQLAVAVVQANIPQELKWYEPAWPDILEKYFVLTKQALLENPELIVWPETAFPGYVGEHDDVLMKLREFVRSIRTPVLLGSVVTNNGQYYNSAVLVDRDGRITQQYHKLHLVPFGEYIPFRSFFPFLSQIVPIADFSAGDNYSLFSLHEGKGFASTLICFEDSVAHLSRGFVKKGSNLFINITNDAWFKDTKAPYLHLQSSVFRAVENRRAVVRAANTGISGFIAPDGSVQKLVRNRQGKPTYVLGFARDRVALSTKKTFYSLYGDVFGYGALFTAIFLIWRHAKSPQRN